MSWETKKHPSDNFLDDQDKDLQTQKETNDWNLYDTTSNSSKASDFDDFILDIDISKKTEVKNKETLTFEQWEEELSADKISDEDLIKEALEEDPSSQEEEIILDLNQINKNEPVKEVFDEEKALEELNQELELIANTVQNYQEDQTISNDSKEENQELTVEQIQDEFDQYKKKQIFGNYQVVFSNHDDNAEVVSSLNEDTKVDSFQHLDDEQILDLAESKYTENIEERHELATYYQTNGRVVNVSEVRSLIEASIYVLGTDGLNLYDIRRVTELPISILKSIIDEMSDYYLNNKNSGLLLVKYGNRYKFVTKKEYTQQITMLLNRKTRKPLTDPALEALAVVAYNQPCTKSTIDKIRNRDSTNAVHRLVELGLIEAQERSDAAGKPWLYCVSQKFYDLYGLESLSELPPIDRDAKYYTDDTGAQNLVILDDEE